jgi:biopolymer transport protein ExbD
MRKFPSTFIAGITACLVVAVLASACKKSGEPCRRELDFSKRAYTGEPRVVITIAVARDASVRLDGRAVTEDDLRRALHARGNAPEVLARIDADGDVPYKHVLHLLDVLKETGIARVSLGDRESESHCP